MSRKHASFDQLIDYIESERKLKSKQFSIFHNTYNRDSEKLKAEFRENAEHLKFRKNGVYLYHEVISITRAEHLEESEQKAILQRIVNEYLQMRARNNLAYAVLHEDKKDNLHFHIVISANEAESQTRKRLSKADFAEIQTRLEKWVLESYPQLEQKAVFYPNQTNQEREEREHKAHISNKGKELQRRTGKTSTRDHIKATLESIFENARDGRHFTDLLEKEHLKIYQRGKQHGVIDQDGTKYRFSTLGLADEWGALDKRMMENLQQQKTQLNTSEHTEKPQEQRHTANKCTHEDTPDNTTLNTKNTLKTEPSHHEHQQKKAERDTKQEKEAVKPQIPNPSEDIATEASTATTGTSPIAAVKEFVLHPTDNPIQREMEEERQRRLAEAEEMRKAKAENQASTGQRNSNKNQQS